MGLLLAAVQGARADTIALRASLDTGGGDLALAVPRRVMLLELNINGEKNRGLAHVTEHDGALWVPARDLAAAGFRVRPTDVAADGTVAIGRLMGVKAAIDSSRQELRVTADPSRAAAQLFDILPNRLLVPGTPATGLAAGYDIAATTGDLSRFAKTTLLGATLDATLFGPPGTLAMSGYGQYQNGESRFVRFDTTAEIDDAARMRRWLFGDLVTGALAWNRPVRIGGIQWASDFSLQPTFTAMPLPTFYGQSAVPASVDVFVNAARVYEADVAPGPFELHDIPVLTGSGEARIVVRDATGQETAQSFSLYGSNDLLRPGLWSFAFDAGALRHAYGEKSFDYGGFAATGTARYGLTPSLTLEAHSEMSDKVQTLGGGATFSLAPIGVLQADIAGSTGRDGAGLLYGASFESRARPLSLFASYQATGGQWRDLASLDGPAPDKHDWQLGASYAFDADSSLSASWIDARDTQATQFASLSYMRSLGPGWYASLSGLYDPVRRAWAVQFFLTLPLGDGLFGTVAADAGPHNEGAAVSTIKPADPDGGVGWRATLSQGDDSLNQAGFSWYGARGSLDTAISETHDRVASQVVASGGLVAMDGSLFATKRPDGAVALVKTGRPDIRVAEENRDVALSDSDGEAVLTNLVPGAPNRIAVEATDYPLSTVVSAAEKIVVPPRGSGVIVDLAPARRRPLLLSLRLADGSPPPPGARLSIEGRPAALVGHRGMVFLPDIAKTEQAVVTFGAQSCRVAIVPPPGPPPDPPRGPRGNAIPEIGPLTCGAAP